MLSKIKINKEVFLLFGIIIFAFLIRLIFINQSFWLDEATTAQVVKNFNFSQIFQKFLPGDFHPPFYYLLAKVWTIPFGVSEISLRMLSVVASLITIFFVYKIAKNAFNKKVGFVSSLLLAISPLHIYYSQEARMYIVQTLFVVLSIFYYQKLLKNEKLINWVLFSFSILLIGITDYLPLSVILVFAIHSLIIKKNIDWFKKLFLSLLPLFVFFVFWLPIFTEQLVNGLNVYSNSPNWWKVLGKFSLKEVFLIPIKFIIGRISFSQKILYGFVLVPYITLLINFFIKEYKRLKNNYLFICWFSLPIFLTILFSLRLSVLSYFRLIFVLPAFYILLARAIQFIGKKYFLWLTAFFLLFNIVFSAIYLFNPSFHREDWRGFVKFVEDNSIPKSAITLFISDSQMEAYNYYSQGIIPALSPAQFEPEYNTIWLMKYVQDLFDPLDLVRINLESLEYTKTQVYDFNGVVVLRYDR